MYITLEANYAVQTVQYLSEYNEKTEAKRISEATRVPLRFLLKILCKLVSAGILESFKGAKGGYVLKKEPKDITMKEVIEAVEGPFVISRCQREEFDCGKPNCALHKVYEDISGEIQDVLASYNFSEIKNTPLATPLATPSGDCCGAEDIPEPGCENCIASEDCERAEEESSEA